MTVAATTFLASGRAGIGFLSKQAVIVAKDLSCCLSLDGGRHSLFDSAGEAGEMVTMRRSTALEPRRFHFLEAAVVFGGGEVQPVVLNVKGARGGFNA